MRRIDHTVDDQLRGARALTEIRKIAMLVFLAAAAVILGSTEAGAAGYDAGYGAPPCALPAGSTSILVAREIPHQGGQLEATIHHGSLLIQIPPHRPVGLVQYIVGQNSLPSPSTNYTESARENTVLAFFVGAELAGSPEKSAGPVNFSFSGPAISTSAHVIIYADGKFVALASSVSNHSIRFSSEPDQAFFVIGK